MTEAEETTFHHAPSRRTKSRYIIIRLLLLALITASNSYNFVRCFVFPLIIAGFECLTSILASDFRMVVLL